MIGDNAARGYIVRARKMSGVGTGPADYGNIDMSGCSGAGGGAVEIFSDSHAFLGSVGSAGVTPNAGVGIWAHDMGTVRLNQTATTTITGTIGDTKINTIVKSYSQLVATNGFTDGGVVTGSGFVRYVPPTADLVSIVAALAIANGPQIILLQPADPCKLSVSIVDADSSITAGSVTIVGTNQSGLATTEAINIANGGTHTYTTANAYAHVTSVTVSALVGAGGLDTISVGQASALGLPAVQGATTFAVYKENVDGADEATGTVDATAGTVIPTTPGNGVHAFEFWYSYAFRPADGCTLTRIQF